MSRQLFAVEGGYKILSVNGSAETSYLFGTADPGLAQFEIDAAVGSHYSKDNGDTYKKIAAGSGTDKWRRNLSADDLLTISPRSEKVIAGTGDAAPSFPAVIDLTANPFGDDEGTTLSSSDFAVDEYTIFGIGGTPVLAKVTAVSAPNVTFDVAGVDALADNDYMVIQNYLPDSPDNQELQAMVQYYGGVINKLGDINWDYADGINLQTGYSALAGNVTSADTVQSAIAKLDGVNDAQDAALGLAQGALNFGTFSGSFLADNQSAKALFQALETEAENIRTLTGTSVGDLNFGSLFTGPLISSNQTLVEVIQQVADAVSSSSVDLKATSVTTEVSLDEISADDYYSAQWLVHISNESSPTNYKSFVLVASHDGDGSNDASVVDDTQYAKLNNGPNINATISVDLNGTGAAQVMRLRVSSVVAVTVRARRVAVKA